jgi:Calcineurin-like phosphoesterase
MNFIRSVLIAFCVVLIGLTGLLSQDATNKSAKVEPDVATGPFLVKPYLQAGHEPAARQLVLVWQTNDTDAAWTVEYRPGTGRRWETGPAPSFTRVAVEGSAPHRIYHTALADLEPGQIFAYRVSHGGTVVFESEAHAPKGAGQAYRFVVFGDCGADTPEERAIAFRTFRAKPDFVMITGDIVYGRGLASEYRTKYWPIYNAEEAAPDRGAPLLRSTLFVAAPGNHDIASRDLGRNPDGLAYFYYWLQPLNGPKSEVGGPITAPLRGPEENIKAFTDAAGKAFPRMANFSFEYGNGHWTVLDANATVDWTNQELRDWLAADLAAAKAATWRFVSFHQPGFNSSKSHFDEQYMRVLAPLFEAGHVDLVFNGHVHNYQRSYPLRFVPDSEAQAAPPDAKAETRSRKRHVDGKLTLDKKFDGQNDTTPDGVIYLVTGAGGQRLYNPEQQDDPASWQDFTYKHISKMHSLTIVDVVGQKLTLRQVTADGDEVDRFVIQK